eukprot:641890-Prymnesium_polylepis.2
MGWGGMLSQTRGVLAVPLLHYRIMSCVCVRFALVSDRYCFNALLVSLTVNACRIRVVRRRDRVGRWSAPSSDVRRIFRAPVRLVFISSTPFGLPELAGRPLGARAP